MCTLYHYCSLDAFLSIIQSRILRFNDITKSNDSKELFWFLDKFNEFAQKLINERYPYKTYDTYRAHLNPDDLRNPYIINSKKHKLLLRVTLGSMFAFCLSEDADSLSQWRGYADDGKGVCIGLNQGALDLSMRAMAGNDVITLIKVSYGDVELKESMEKLFEDFDASPGNAANSCDDRGNSDSLHEGLYIAARHKNPSFAEEREWRIICDPTKLKEEDELYKRIKYRFRTNGVRIIPYFDLRINNLSELIDEIVIGPKSIVTEDDVRLVLCTLGSISKAKEINVRQSISSYR